MKLSISNIAWKTENDLEMYSLLKQYGFSGVEIAPTRLWPVNPYEQIDEASKYANWLWDNYQLRISSMQSIWFGMSQLLFHGKEERNELLLYTKRAIDFANAIGCPNLVFGCPKNRITKLDEKGYQTKEDEKIALDFFTELGEYAYIHHTCLSIEPNLEIYGTNYINTTLQAIELVKKVNQNGFRVNGDLGTFLYNKETLDIFSDNIKLFQHIHISEPGLERIKEREVHRELYKLLNEADYQGYISIEMKYQDCIEDVRGILEYVRSICTK